jgi:hypothetical protein
MYSDSSQALESWFLGVLSSKLFPEYPALLSLYEPLNRISAHSRPLQFDSKKGLCGNLRYLEPPRVPPCKSTFYPSQDCENGGWTIGSGFTKRTFKSSFLLFFLRRALKYGPHRCIDLLFPLPFIVGIIAILVDSLLLS